MPELTDDALRDDEDDVMAPTRIDALAAELFAINRDAAQRAHRLVGQLPVLSGFQRVEAEVDLDDEQRVHFILHRLIPDYLERLPGGMTFMGIRELFKWRAGNGEPQSLQARYDNAIAVMGGFRCADFARRWEPKLTSECAVVFNQLDQDDRLQARRAGPAARSAGVAQLPPDDTATGILGIHERLDLRRVADDIRAATREIVILNTFIPAMTLLEEPLETALANGACARILLLHPESRAVSLRSQALPGASSGENRVRREIKYCLDVLADVADGLDDAGRGRLAVRVYDSLPSLALYRVDGRALVSIFVHGQTANDAPQLELGRADSLIGRTVYRELDWLWNIAWEFHDVRRWPQEISEMGPA
jgi:hypothetical protein